MCSSYPEHKNTYLSASSCPIPTQLGTHHLPMYVDPLALLSSLPKCSRNQNMDIHEHPLPGPISQKRVHRFSPFFAHRSFTIIPTGVPICSPKFCAHVSSNSLFHESRCTSGAVDRSGGVVSPFGDISRHRDTQRCGRAVDRLYRISGVQKPVLSFET